MKLITIDLNKKNEDYKWKKKHILLTPKTWLMLRSYLYENKQWLSPNLILKAFLLKTRWEGLSLQPFYENGSRISHKFELHFPDNREDLNKLVAKAVELYRGIRLNGLADDSINNEVESIWDDLVKQTHLLYPIPYEWTHYASPFPVYDARLTSIPKKRPGEFRIIAVPSDDQLNAGRSILPVLYSMLDLSLPIHGFVPGRNAVTNAKPHLGFKWTLSFDLKDFFDHVDIEKLLNAAVPYSIAKLITDTKGIARQGYATSPAASNLAFQPTDRKIIELLAKKFPGAVYTRYADDLTISFNDEECRCELQDLLTKIIQESGFKICSRKTHCWAAKRGRRVITGVSVGQSDLRPTRAIRRRLRACEHAGDHLVAAGLREWSFLKIPNLVKIV